MANEAGRLNRGASIGLRARVETHLHVIYIYPIESFDFRSSSFVRDGTPCTCRILRSNRRAWLHAREVSGRAASKVLDHASNSANSWDVACRHYSHHTQSACPV